MPNAFTIHRCNARRLFDLDLIGQKQVTAGSRRAFFVKFAVAAVSAVVAIIAYAIASDRYLPGLLASDLPKADRIVVSKAEKKLRLYRGRSLLAEYSAAFGDNPVGHKRQEGDERTPEGEYIIDWRNEKSSYYKSLHISYPNEKDKADAKARNVSPGGMIMIHGQKNRFGWLAPITQNYDWTDGCIAVANTDMEEIWRSVENGTAISIEP